MADSILRLKVDSSEYDNKVKRAGQTLLQLEQDARKTGATFAKTDDYALEFAKALGSMDTSSKTSKQQLRELTNTLTDLTSVYMRMSDEEKSSPFGKALADSMQQLTERAGVVRDSMIDVAVSIQHASSDTRTFDQLAQGMSVATAGFQGLTGAGKLLGIEMGNDVEVIAKLEAAMAVTNSLTTIQTALQKESALMQGVLAARTALAAAAQKALAIATGNATVAQKAYNAIANANPLLLLASAIGAVVGALSSFGSAAEEAEGNFNKTTDAINGMTAAAERYLDISKQLGASEETLNGQRVNDAKRLLDYATKARQDIEQQIRTAIGNHDIGTVGDLSKQLEDARKAEAEAQKSYGKALDARRDSAQIRLHVLRDWQTLETENERSAAISILTKMRKDAKEGSAWWSELQRRIDYLERKNNNSVSTTTTTTNRPSNTNSPTVKVKVDTTESRTELQRLQDELKTVENSMAPYGKASEEWKEMNDYAEGLRKRIMELNGETEQLTIGMGGLTKASISAFNSMLEGAMSNMEFGSSDLTDTLVNSIDASTLGNLLTVTIKQGLDITKEQLSNGQTAADLWDTIVGGENIPDSTWKELEAIINEKLKELNLGPIEIDVKTGEVSQDVKENAKDMAKDWNAAASGIRAVGSALQQIEDPAAKVIGTIAQAIATIALTFAQSLKGTFTPWDWIAAAATGTATMISTIAAIKSATTMKGYAEGGIIKGNSYSNDRIGGLVDGGQLVGLNAGEVVLTKAMQGNLASQLDDAGGGGRSGYTPSHVSGEQIWIALNAFTKRTGRGELVTWR